MLAGVHCIHKQLTGDSRVVLHLVILSMTRLIWLYIYDNYVKGKMWPFPYKGLSAEDSAFLSDHLPVCFCLFLIPRGQFYLSFLKFCSLSWDIFLVQQECNSAASILRKQKFYNAWFSLVTFDQPIAWLPFFALNGYFRRNAELRKTTSPCLHRGKCLLDVKLI